MEKKNRYLRRLSDGKITQFSKRFPSQYDESVYEELEGRPPDGAEFLIPRTSFTVLEDLRKLYFQQPQAAQLRFMDLMLRLEFSLLQDQAELARSCVRKELVANAQEEAFKKQCLAQFEE